MKTKVHLQPPEQSNARPNHNSSRKTSLGSPRSKLVLVLLLDARLASLLLIIYRQSQQGPTV